MHPYRYIFVDDLNSRLVKIAIDDEYVNVDEDEIVNQI